MEAHLTSVLNGVARSMAPSGLKKDLSYRAVELALQGQCERDGEVVRGTSATATSSGAAHGGPDSQGFRTGQGSTAFG